MVRRLRQLAAFIIGTFLFTTVSAFAAATITPTFFGMTSDGVIFPPTTLPTGSFGKGSCVSWADIETSRGVYPSSNWAYLDSFVNLAKSNKVDLLYSFGERIPQWSVASADQHLCFSPPSYCSGAVSYCYDAPQSNSDLADFITTVVNRYGHDHIVYELWNEPYDISPTLGTAGATVTSAQMGQMVLAEYNAIRAADSKATIISPSMFSGFGSNSFYNYALQTYQNGNPIGVDAVSAHGYAFTKVNGQSVSDLPESIMPFFPNNYITGDTGTGLLSIISKYVPGKPLWDTEGSFNDTANHPDFTTNAALAAYVARWYLLHWAAGFQRAYWYSWNNATYGTLNPAQLSGDTTRQTAYAQVYNWMVGKQMTQPCIWASDHITWTCGFTGPQGYKSLAVWRTSGTASYIPPNTSQWTQYRDLAGVTHTYSGSGSVTIGISPILFENCARKGGVPPPLTGAVPSNFFGMHFNSFPTAITIGAAGKGGCIQWADIQTTPTNYYWTLLDSQVAAAKAHGVDYLYSFNIRWPQWAIAPADQSYCKPEPTFCPLHAINYCYDKPIISDLTAFAKAVVKRYGHDHIVYELMNEPYDDSPTLGTPGATVTPQQMAVVTSAIYSAIRATDPQAFIVSASMYSGYGSNSYANYFSQYFAAGAPTSVDAISVHGYTQSVANGDAGIPTDVPESITTEYGNLLTCTGSHNQTCNYILGNSTSGLGAVIAEYEPGKTLWDTEGSWDTPTQSPDFSTDAEQAAFIGRWYLIHWGAGFQRAYWYSYDNSIFGTMKQSLTGSPLQEEAFTNVQSWMTGRQMNQTCTWNSDHVTWTCGFVGSNNYHSLAVWDTAGSESYTPPSPSTYTQYRDLAGNVTSYDGSSSVTIGISPILFEN